MHSTASAIDRKLGVTVGLTWRATRIHDRRHTFDNIAGPFGLGRRASSVSSPSMQYNASPGFVQGFCDFQTDPLRTSGNEGMSIAEDRHVQSMKMR